MPAPFLVAIVGGSASGKTTLARALAATLNEAAVLLAEDDYYRCSSTVPDFDPEEYNFDEPVAKDHALLAAQLAALKRGEPLHRPDYCLITHTRKPTPVPVPARPIVIVEGLHLLIDQTLRAQFDLSVFVDCPADVRLARRVARDVTERGRETLSVLGQYLANVRPMYDRHVAPQAQLADLVVDGEGERAHTLKAILARLPEHQRE